MSKLTKIDTAGRDGGSLERRLARWLESPVLARVVPHLPPEAVHQLIRHRGLEACGELLAWATPAQLNLLVELDLWRHPRPGHDHRFDADRFGEWLEVLVDAGESVAVRTVAALDPNVVVAGLSRHVRVLDPGIFEPTAQSDDEPPDRHEAMREGDATDAAGEAPGRDPSGDECEVGGYIVRARRADAWDAIVTLLLALEVEHGPTFHALMQGCRRLSNSRAETDGLDDLLPAPAQHLHDVTIEREHRRSRQGYATPADARAFLETARRPRPTRSGASTESIRVDPIVAAYFRAVDEASEPNETAELRAHAHATDVPEALEAVLQLLAEAGMTPTPPRALLERGDADPQAARLTLLRRLMAFARDTHESAYFTRRRELAFLANTLLAGCSVQARPFTPQEASDAAAGICNLGLESWPAQWPSETWPGASSPPVSWVVEHDLVTAFEVGWSVLHAEVGLFAADQLLAALNDVHCVDRDTRRGLSALRHTLVKERDAGTPWRAREAAEVLALLDPIAWVCVRGLLDECPVLPAALTAVLEGRSTSVCPTRFAFISTVAQIRDVHAFLRKLPGLLSG
jgi:hypothetical protein